ncbi:nucleoside deaminase [Methylobacterium currus]|uniref:tRNA-specific adenosine deaminase n=1 Tax=Methylobacterium currus TaxID=2051553 RepID=A0A2R4WVU6_9HYPH|nr:nucleoside deaminase [Methylobacterium currus]
MRDFARGGARLDPSRQDLARQDLSRQDLSRPDPLGLAFDAAREAAARGEVPVGAAVVRDGVVLAVAGNRPRADRDPTAHAEILAIRAACAALDDERLTGCDLYVTLEPCAMCAGAISFARIRRLYFAASDPKGGAVENGPRFFNQPTCHHAPEVYGGLRESEAAALLRDFFRDRRP